MNKNEITALITEHIELEEQLEKLEKARKPLKTTSKSGHTTIDEILIENRLNEEIINEKSKIQSDISKLNNRISEIVNVLSTLLPNKESKKKIVVENEQKYYRMYHKYERKTEEYFTMDGPDYRVYHVYKGFKIERMTGFTKWIWQLKKKLKK
ncbi:MAG: hypothetical protein ACPG5B_06650 [Chitinophagales bacterium]